MFYYYFRFFNNISTLFGQRKPFVTCNSSGVGSLSKFWSLVIAFAITISSLLTINFSITFNIKKNDEVVDINEFVVCLIVYLTNLRREEVFIRLYELINKVLADLKLTKKSVKLFTVKLSAWLTFLTFFYLIAIVMEVLYLHPPFILILRIPLYLSLLHLYTHLCIILSVLKIINTYMSQIFRLNSDNSFLVEDFTEPKNNFMYIIGLDIRFIKVKQNRRFDLKHLCKTYDDLSSCSQYLRKLHSLQIILTTWLMFSSAVGAVALLSTEKMDTQWLHAVNGLLPFFWFGIGCFIDDQIRQEVEKTDLIIIKHLIDFRCDSSSKEVLNVFKQAINTNGLQFKAGNMYKLNYATMLGTLVSVITYSIIVIQLF